MFIPILFVKSDIVFCFLLDYTEAYVYNMFDKKRGVLKNA